MNDPKKIQKMMKKMNMNLTQIEAEKVVIHKKDGKTIIMDPEIMVVDMMGRDVYQISGTVHEQSVTDEDVDMVMEQTGKDKDTVVAKLEELNNDLARAIKELSESNEEK